MSPAPDDSEEGTSQKLEKEEVVVDTVSTGSARVETGRQVVADAIQLVTRKGQALRRLSDALRGNREVVSVAVKQDGFVRCKLWEAFFVDCR